MKRIKLIILFVIMLTVMGVGTACKSSQSDIVTYGKSELPGGGIQIPHNERLHLSTDQKWIEKEGHLSDLIRLQWTAERAKPAIVWVDEKGKDKTAIVSHDKANDPKQHDHKHISFETTMSPEGEYAGQLFTRLEIPYDTDISEIRTHSANFNVMNGVMRVAGDAGSNRDIQLGDTGKDNLITPRWSIRADSSAETKDNLGTDLQLIRYGNDGQALDSPFMIQRQTGNVGIGTTTPENKLDVNDDRIRIRDKFTPASSDAPCSQGQMAWDEQYTYVCVSPNEWKRSEISSW